jgi:hypothetical protein
VRPEAEKRYNDQLSADLERTIWTQCDSYFRSPTGRIVTQWPYTELEYARRTWRLRSRDWIHRTGAAPASACADTAHRIVEKGVEDLFAAGAGGTTQD